MLARIGAARRVAKMRATTKGAIRIDQAFTRIAFEQWTRAIMRFRKFFATRGAKTFCGDERLAFGEVGGLAGELKLAALSARHAGTFQRALRQLGVNGADLGENRLQCFAAHGAFECQSWRPVAS